VSYKRKRPWPDGRTHLVLEPVAFLRRLVGIIPPPWRHLVRWEDPASPHQPTTTARPSPWPRPSWRRPTVATMTLAGPPHTLAPAIVREPAKAAASERPFVRPGRS